MEDREKLTIRKEFFNTGKLGDSDRHIGIKMPRHLFSGKRKIGKLDYRWVESLKKIIVYYFLYFKFIY